MKIAKRTRFGRLLCRLFGEETGQAMMEYVVLGVLVVAAAVAVVILFGDTIREQFHIMITAPSNPKEAATIAQTERDSIDGKYDLAKTTADTIAGSSNSGSDQSEASE